MKIFVGKLSREVNKEALLGLFTEYGKVGSFDVLIDKINGEWLTFAFIDMQKSEATAAIDALDGKKFNGDTLSVHTARVKTEDRRFDDPPPSPHQDL